MQPLGGLLLRLLAAPVVAGSGLGPLLYPSPPLSTTSHVFPLGVVGVQTRVHDFVHPGDHDFLKNVGYLFGLLLGARHDQLVVGEVVLVTASRRLL
jgi:hypothetical protein